VRPYPRRFGSPDPPPPPSRQRRRLAPDQDAFHRRVLPPPVVHRAFAPRTWDLEEPATGVAARVLMAFATATRLPARFRPSSCHPCKTAGAGGLDPWPFGWTKRRSSTSATNTTREHTTVPPEPRLLVERACARARRSQASPRRSHQLRRRALSGPCGPSFARRRQPPPPKDGWRPHAGSCLPRGLTPVFRHGLPCGPPSRSRNPRRTRLSPLPTFQPDRADVNRALSSGVDGHQPRFHGPGAGMLCCQRSSRAR